jgi:signal transduction histidine kinase
MRSGPLSRLWASFAFRLSLWYAGVFTVSAAVLFALMYFLLTSFVARSEREIISARLKECAAVYEGQGGVSALNDLLHRDSSRQQEGSFFIRVTGRRGSVLLLVAPADWLQMENRAPSAIDPYRSTHQAWLSIPKDERSEFIIASAFLNDGAVLQVGRSATRAATLLRPFLIAFSLAMGPTLLLGLAGGGVFAYRATAPVREVVRTARRIVSTGDLAARVPETLAASELAELARQFNRVLEKNQSLIRAMREALDNVAHDLRTPLTRLRASAQNVLQADATAPAGPREALADCVEESDRVLTILNTLMDITEAETGMMTLRRQMTPVARLLGQVVELYSLLTEEKNITVHTSLDDPCQAEIDSTRIRQAFANLLDNAAKYTPAGGEIFVACRPVDEGGNKKAVRVTVRDSGIGIAPHEQGRIWERLYRGDRSRSQRGLGLGLSLVKAVVEAHGGSVTVKSVPEQGAEFAVTLPVCATPAANNVRSTQAG